MESKNWEYKPKVEYEKLYPLVDRVAVEEYEKAKAAWEKEIERMKSGAIRTMSIDDPPVKYTHKTADEWFDIIKHLDEENRDNLMKAILIFLEKMNEKC